MFARVRDSITYGEIESSGFIADGNVLGHFAISVELIDSISVKMVLIVTVK